MEIHPMSDAIGGEIPAAIDRALTAVRAAYDSLTLPVAVFDASTRTIASPTLHLRRRLADVALSKYLTCGTAQGGQGADTYEIQLSMQTVLHPGTTDGTTQLMTSIRRAMFDARREWKKAADARGGLHISQTKLSIIAGSVVDPATFARNASAPGVSETHDDAANCATPRASGEAGSADMPPVADPYTSIDAATPVFTIRTATLERGRSRGTACSARSATLR